MGTKIVHNQKVIEVNKVCNRYLIDIRANKQSLKVLSCNAFMLYMYLMLHPPGHKEALSLNHIRNATTLTERGYYKAIDELIEKEYLVKEYHKDYNNFYRLYENTKKFHKDREIQAVQNNKITIEDYIDKYLNPNRKFGSDVTDDEQINLIMDIKFENDTDIAQKINTMSYKDFLKTPYWKAISLYKKKNAKCKCELCQSTIHLQTHHKTYDNHGYEHNKDIADKDLIVLCGKCHRKMHNLNDDTEETQQND